jgi:hypothetical protein
VAGDAGHLGGAPSGVEFAHARNVLRPEHREVRVGHLVAGRQVQPDLEQLQWIGCGRVQQRKHLGMHDAAPGGQPLHITTAKACDGAQRIRMVHAPAAHDGHGLEAAVRVRREAGHGHAVVHAPAVQAGKVLAQLPTGQGCVRAEATIAARVGVVVMDAKQKGVDRRPLETQRLDAKDGVGGHRRVLDGEAQV